VDASAWESGMSSTDPLHVYPYARELRLSRTARSIAFGDGELGERIFAALWLGREYITLRADEYPTSTRLDVMLPLPVPVLSTEVASMPDERVRCMSFRVEMLHSGDRCLLLRRISDDDRSRLETWLEERCGL